MKRATAISFALFIGSITLAAQSASPQKTQAIVVHAPAANGVCPVAMHVRQAASGDALAVNNGRPKGIAQGFHLILTTSDSRQITGARITVSGLTAKSRVTETLSSQDDSADAAKTLDVTFSAGPGKEASADLWAPGLTAVRTIDLDSVTYADGSIWKLAAGHVCRTVPDPIMQIGTR